MIQDDNFNSKHTLLQSTLACSAHFMKVLKAMFFTPFMFIVHVYVCMWIEEIHKKTVKITQGDSKYLIESYV